MADKTGNRSRILLRTMSPVPAAADRPERSKGATGVKIPATHREYEEDDDAGQQEQAQDQAGTETEGEPGQGGNRLRRRGIPRPVRPLTSAGSPATTPSDPELQEQASKETPGTA